ncbi:MAG: exodeoxyribonuclease III [Albidovulum sp.]|nr:exodeoxyribonuclease III [Albidovulum sp.]MDE0531281.1 exodeoxyribonuclease III [Albidovulum sp.]
MKIASFNINGIKARFERLSEYLEEAKPDVALLQEIKSNDENFPRESIEELGYNVETHGQKNFNGVAILSKIPLEDVARGLPKGHGDDQARWIEATVVGRTAVRICNLYLPNGNPAPGPKFDYKLEWMEWLKSRAEELIESEQVALMAGDYNVIPCPDDVYEPVDWENDALFLPETKAAWRRIENLGFTDAFRVINNKPLNYTFWDFQRGAWQKNEGLRIDHFLLTPQCADLLKDCQIDRYMRGKPKPSDHVPVWVELDV